MRVMSEIPFVRIVLINQLTSERCGTKKIARQVGRKCVLERVHVREKNRESVQHVILRAQAIAERKSA